MHVCTELSLAITPFRSMDHSFESGRVGASIKYSMNGSISLYGSFYAYPYTIPGIYGVHSARAIRTLRLIPFISRLSLREQRS